MDLTEAQIEEARVELCRRACASNGHDLATCLWGLLGEPTTITCSRCGVAWSATNRVPPLP
jgi:hypothetical protein